MAYYWVKIYCLIIKIWLVFTKIHEFPHTGRFGHFLNNLAINDFLYANFADKSMICTIKPGKSEKKACKTRHGVFHFVF